MSNSLGSSDLADGAMSKLADELREIRVSENPPGFAGLDRMNRLRLVASFQETENHTQLQHEDSVDRRASLYHASHGPR